MNQLLQKKLMHLDSVYFEIKNMKVYKNNKLIFDFTAMRPPQRGPVANAEYGVLMRSANHIGAKNLKTYIQMLYTPYLSSHANYQCFDEIGICKGLTHSPVFCLLSAVCCLLSSVSSLLSPLSSLLSHPPSSFFFLSH